MTCDTCRHAAQVPRHGPTLVCLRAKFIEGANQAAVIAFERCLGKYHEARK